MYQEDYLKRKVQEVSSRPTNITFNDIKIGNNTLDKIVQVWNDVCECKESQFFKDSLVYLLETIETLKNDMNEVKSQNKKLIKENVGIKNEMEELSKNLEKLQLERHKKMKRLVVGTDGAGEDTRLQGSSITPSNRAWLFSTEQWLENVVEMNPSTDSDNFEKTNCMKGKTSGTNNGESNSEMEREEGEDVIHRCRSSYFEEYDEVFEDVKEAESTSTYPNDRTPRVRRISDVIDSIGDISPPHLTKEKSLNFFSIDLLQVSPPRGHRIPTMTDSPSSPPMTPGSDLGYGSTGMPTPPSNAMLAKTKSFRFSSSSMDIAASPPRFDTQLDAKPIGKEAQTSMGSTSLSKPEEAVMPAERASREYNMKHARRGKAVIFNHEEFRDMPQRKGSSVDVKRLTTALEGLGFTVETYNDLEIEKLKTVIAELSTEDHSDADCLIVTVLTHGLSTGCLMAKDYAYPTEHLWTPFSADKCPSLAGKPKIFFIQACRGSKFDPGMRLVNQDQTDNIALSYKIPTMADFLLAYSTFEGFFSWRHPENGTWFVQCLCDVLEEEGQKNSLQDLLLEVSRKVAIDYESYNDLYNWQHEQKQVPQINSTLLRQVYFFPKD
ncbi:uncharacterized protein LOC142322137 isoform X2 [Lycorma delicatula]|uniref:uncharacterized protein LOC142322137 isoform X2 n=1 Tax=Lycorma delicatula TaxID=130591 RepID=UPI003F515A3F